MDIDALAAARRTAFGSANARRLRDEGKVPAVLYGHGEDVLPLALASKDVQTLVESGHHMVTLTIEGKQERALVKEVQFDGWQSRVLHVDFARVALDETVTIAVEIKTHGQPKAVLAGGVLEQPMHQMHIECKADHIPDTITIEIGHLEMNQMLHVRDVPLPEGVKALDEADALVVVIHEPRGVVEEEAPAPAEAEAQAEPEVIGRGGAEEEQQDQES